MRFSGHTANTHRNLHYNWEIMSAEYKIPSNYVKEWKEILSILQFWGPKNYTANCKAVIKPCSATIIQSNLIQIWHTCYNFSINIHSIDGKTFKHDTSFESAIASLDVLSKTRVILICLDITAHRIMHSTNTISRLGYNTYLPQRSLWHLWTQGSRMIKASSAAFNTSSAHWSVVHRHIDICLMNFCDILQANNKLCWRVHHGWRDVGRLVFYI